MMNVNPHDRTRPHSVRNDSSSNFSYSEPVDGSSISQAYPEQHTMDMDAFMPPRGPSRSSSNSYRSTDHTSRPSVLALSARLISAESLERSGELAKDQVCYVMPDPIQTTCLSHLARGTHTRPECRLLVAKLG